MNNPRLQIRILCWLGMAAFVAYVLLLWLGVG